jgi:hypothetical protein
MQARLLYRTAVFASALLRRGRNILLSLEALARKKKNTRTNGRYGQSLVGRLICCRDPPVIVPVALGCCWTRASVEHRTDGRADRLSARKSINRPFIQSVNQSINQSPKQPASQGHSVRQRQNLRGAVTHSSHSSHHTSTGRYARSLQRALYDKVQRSTSPG